MKKIFFIAITVLAGSVVFAQQKKENPPPPPPPKMLEVKEIAPPPPPPPPKPAAAEKINHPKDYSEFLKRNPTVKGIGWTDNQVRIRLKSGQEEQYFLNNKSEMQKLMNQYGELPAQPPPPPPPPKLVKVKTIS